MSVPFPIRAGDLLPVLTGKATYRDETKAVKNFNFTGWTDWTFTAVGATKTITGATVTAAGNTITYQWAGTDTDTPGTYVGKFSGVDPEGRRQTFPTKGGIEIEIVA